MTRQDWVSLFWFEERMDWVRCAPFPVSWQCALFE